MGGRIGGGGGGGGVRGAKWMPAVVSISISI